MTTSPQQYLGSKKGKHQESSDGGSRKGKKKSHMGKKRNESAHAQMHSEHDAKPKMGEKKRNESEAIKIHSEHYAKSRKGGKKRV
jgi:hypothetical protein